MIVFFQILGYMPDVNIALQILDRIGATWSATSLSTAGGQGSVVEPDLMVEIRLEI